MSVGNSATSPEVNVALLVLGGGRGGSICGSGLLCLSPKAIKHKYSDLYLGCV